MRHCNRLPSWRQYLWLKCHADFDAVVGSVAAVCADDDDDADEGQPRVACDP